MMVILEKLKLCPGVVFVPFQSLVVQNMISSISQNFFVSSLPHQLRYEYCLSILIYMSHFIACKHISQQLKLVSHKISLSHLS